MKEGLKDKDVEEEIVGAATDGYNELVEDGSLLRWNEVDCTDGPWEFNTIGALLSLYDGEYDGVSGSRSRGLAVGIGFGDAVGCAFSCSVDRVGNCD